MNEARIKALQAALELEHHGNVETLIDNARRIEEYITCKDVAKKPIS